MPFFLKILGQRFENDSILDRKLKYLNEKARNLLFFADIVSSSVYSDNDDEEGARFQVVVVQSRSSFRRGSGHCSIYRFVDLKFE
jgi:hypothetical protein